jgi:hypothetical protein
MQKARDTGAKRTGPEFVVAVYDNWDALHAALIGLDTDTLHAGAVLHARKDVPPAPLNSGLLKEMTYLHFSRSRQDVACTVGPLEQELSARLAGGVRSLTDALHGWFSRDQAEQLEDHIGKGRLVLCLRLGTPEGFSVVCGRLVQTSPHIVELCNIKFGVNDAVDRRRPRL